MAAPSAARWSTVAVPGVDLIISGHSHSGYSGKINNIPIIQQYSSGTAIGVSDLRYDRLFRNIATSKLQVVTTYNAGITPDRGDRSAGGRLPGRDRTHRECGQGFHARASSPGDRTDTRWKYPWAISLLTRRAWKGGTQIAFMNPGGIRADIAYATYPHDITWGDFFTVQPFDNKLVTMTLTGSQIYDLLEQQFKPPQSSMKLLQESGIKYSFNLSKPVGSRITA